MGRGNQSKKAPCLPEDGKLPVTLLCGFLGSGKTTLLKHVLETKHADENFKCAVIVNDMAELNIDKSLIDQTSLIQSDEAMVGMQNGCICCTLQNDLVDQIVGLTQKKMFNYILIEASGVSEPHEIAPLFELHEHEEGEETDHDHSKPQLGEVARLDTCVTMIDSAEFHNNLGSMKTYDECDVVGTIAELMMDQVEFANVIVLNKGDLVNEEQTADIKEKISLLNPKAQIVTSIQSKIDVPKILNTSLYKDKDEFWVTSTKTAEFAEERVKRGGGPEACTARFDIKSFVYRARKPFHPGRLQELVLEPFFMDPFLTSEDEDENSDTTEDKEDKQEEENLKEMQEIQDEALVKQKKRNEVMGELLRSKGFIWLASSHDVIGGWQQAGNVLRMEAEMPWMCLIPERWEGTKSEEMVLQEMRQPNGEDWLYKDRRQEIVFIGHRMKHDVIQNLFDQCLLSDEEMAMGPDQWKDQWGDIIPLDQEEEEGEDEEEEGEDEEEEGEDDDKEKFEPEVEISSKATRRKRQADKSLKSTCPAEAAGDCPESEECPLTTRAAKKRRRNN